MRMKSYAKINLALDILGRREDGYHDLDTIFQQVDLADEIEVTLRDDGIIDVRCSRPELGGEHNICYKAARLMKERFGLDVGVSVYIEKVIPVGAGLGGGSGNAAAVLKCINYLCELGLSRSELMALGAELGMDVPFHVIGGTCRGRGRGDRISEMKPIPRRYVVIVYPGYPVSTAEAYADLAYLWIGRTGAAERMAAGYDDLLLHNDFEFSVFGKHPELDAIREQLGSHALLSGSGSCVFGLYESQEEAVWHWSRLRERYRDCFLAETLNRDIAYAQEMGICSGVKRALDRIMQVEDGRGIYVLGSLVHNRQVMEKLHERGIRFISDYNVINEGTVVISAHGVSDHVARGIRKKGLTVIDVTCPVVKKLHDITREKEKEGKKVIIVGDAQHAEIKGITGNLKNYKVITAIDELSQEDLASPLVCVSQTTTQIEKFDSIIRALEERCRDVEIIDTICSATKKRQRSAQDLARQSDIMIVLGSRISANTTRLYEICAQYCETRHIETEKELMPDYFIDKRRIGITAGASTPDWLIESLDTRIRLML